MILPKLFPFMVVRQERNINKMSCEIHLGDNLEIMSKIKTKFSLVYADIPFNTGKKQERNLITVKQSNSGNRKGFGDISYETISEEKSAGYEDSFEDFESFIMPRIKLSYDLLTDNGSLMIHCDQRESHYLKVWMDKAFGRDKFLEELVWAFDWGARSKKLWSKKHNTIFWYVKNPKDYIFNYDAIDRVPYLSQGLVSPEKQALGKPPTSVWSMTIVPTNSKEKTGYATQKPEHLLRRIIKVHSNEGDYILDMFSGSGTTGAVALQQNRNCVMIDSNPEAIGIMQKRFENFHHKAFLDDGLVIEHFPESKQN
jgi:site-specific DNA-methyltransferase (adenine-specific)